MAGKFVDFRFANDFVGLKLQYFLLSKCNFILLKISIHFINLKINHNKRHESIINTN